MSLPFLPHGDLNVWVTALGYVGIALIVFSESALFFCFFFPGDSLLFTAGLIASRAIFNIHILIALLIIMAFIGYFVNYFIGFYLGAWLSARPNTWYFKKKYLEQTRVFYEKHGKKALILGRFMPAVRTFVPLLAGTIAMQLRTFAVLNFLGAVCWVGLVTLSGYFLGGVFPKAQNYLLLITALIIVLSVSPGFIEWYKMRKTTRAKKTVPSTKF